IQVTKDIAEERGYSVDMAGFERAEETHSTVSGGGQAMGKIASADEYNQILSDLKARGVLSADGVAYQPYGPTTITAQVVAVLQNGHPVEQVLIGDKVEIVLDQTPFYVEAGGQVSDTGTIEGTG